MGAGPASDDPPDQLPLLGLNSCMRNATFMAWSSGVWKLAANRAGTMARTGLGSGHNYATYAQSTLIGPHAAHAQALDQRPSDDW